MPSNSALTPRHRGRDLREDFSIISFVNRFIEYGYNVACLPHTTMKTRRSHLECFAKYFANEGLTDIRELTDLDLEDYFVDYGITHAKSTTNTSKRIMKAFLTWLITKRRIELQVNPSDMKEVKDRRRVPKAIPDSVTVNVIRKAPIMQDRLVIALLREGGLRISEIVQVRVCDVNGSSVLVQGKGDRERVVEITPALGSALTEFARDQYRTRTDPLFQNIYRGYPQKMTINTLRKRIQRAYMRYGGEHVTPHQLRHAMAYGLLKEGCDLVTIQYQLGHEYLTTTQIYLRVEDSFRKTAYQKSMPKSILEH